MQRLSVRKAQYALLVRGMARSPVRGLSVADSIFLDVRKGTLLQGLEDLVLRNVVIQTAQP